MMQHHMVLTDCAVLSLLAGLFSVRDARDARGTHVHARHVLDHDLRATLRVLCHVLHGVQVDHPRSLRRGDSPRRSDHADLYSPTGHIPDSSRRCTC